MAESFLSAAAGCASATSKENVSKTLRTDSRASPARTIRNRSCLGVRMANHSDKSTYEVIEEGSAIPGVFKSKWSVLCEWEVARAFASATGYCRIAALRAVLPLRSISSGIRGEAEVDLHVNRHHHLSRTTRVTRIYPLDKIKGRILHRSRIERSVIGQPLSKCGLREPIIEQRDEKSIVDHILVLWWSPWSLKTRVSQISIPCSMQCKQNHNICLAHT